MESARNASLTSMLERDAIQQEKSQQPNNKNKYKHKYKFMRFCGVFHLHKRLSQS